MHFTSTAKSYIWFKESPHLVFTGYSCSISQVIRSPSTANDMKDMANFNCVISHSIIPIVTKSIVLVLNTLFWKTRVQINSMTFLCVYSGTMKVFTFRKFGLTFWFFYKTFCEKALLVYSCFYAGRTYLFLVWFNHIKSMQFLFLDFLCAVYWKLGNLKPRSDNFF